MLRSRDDSHTRLVALVRHVDAPYEQAMRRGEYEAPLVPLVEQVIARATHALVEHLLPHLDEPARERVLRTGAAARAFYLQPSEENWVEFSRAATDSYPFGPGDGCLALEELGGHGAPGSGDVSGVGFLESTAQYLGTDVLLGVLERALVPWLEDNEIAGEDDRGEGRGV